MLKRIIRRLIYGKIVPPLPPGAISKKSIKEYLDENAIILEAGASDGGDTLEMSSLFPKGKIYAFEPVASFYDQLKEKLKDHNNVQIFPYALSDTTGSQQFNLSRDEQGNIASSSSLLKPKEHLTEHPEILFTEAITVQTITIDDFCHQNKIEKIDFLWLDIQGNEYHVLKASPKILKTVKVIHAEVSLIDTYEDTLKYPEFKSWLSSQGFEVAIEALPWRDMGNVLFVRK